MKSTERFSQTVQDYIMYRPTYPVELIQKIMTECHLTNKSIIADIGSGTGLFSRLFLELGNTVYGVEPNKPMREAAEKILTSFKNFHSIQGTAEMTSLKNESVDLITAATAFHWFDQDKAKKEFKRILRSPGWVALVWNIRNSNDSPLLNDYEHLILKFGKDYAESNARTFDKSINELFFSPFTMKTFSFHHTQTFDWNGFKGRLLSTSYSLRPGEKGFNEMLLELRKIYERYEKNGLIEFLYESKLFLGQLK